MSVEFKPLDFAPAYRKVAAALLERITDRTLSTGDRLPAELELARQFGYRRRLDVHGDSARTITWPRSRAGRTRDEGDPRFTRQDLFAAAHLERDLDKSWVEDECNRT